LSRLAVIVVTHESTGVLPATLRTLVPQLRDDDELVVVDCDSRDDPGGLLRELAPAARLIELGENRGFAGGALVGARESSAPLLLFLNPDAVPQPGCLDALRAAAEAQPRWGAWQPLVTLPGGTLVNARGGVTHFLGFGWAGGHGEPVESVPTQPFEVPFASGAALAVRRSAWDSVGGIEAAYFMYGEDLDLSLRLRLAEWGVGTAPAARVEHDYEFLKGDYKWFHLERNRWWTVIGTYPTTLLVLVAPALLVFELALFAAATRGGWLGAKLRADVAVLWTLPWALRRRRDIQASRRISAGAFAGALSASLDSPFLDSAARFGALRRLQACYWRGARGVIAGRRAESSP
jgi:N-acetylglucosaminyl-diphospho-decaprenol L-rhamnosyltransferase